MQIASVGLDRLRNIRVVDDQHEALCRCWNAAEPQRRIDPWPVARELRRNDGILLEVRACDSQLAGAGEYSRRSRHQQDRDRSVTPVLPQPLTSNLQPLTSSPRLYNSPNTSACDCGDIGADSRIARFQ